jgi:hypothetical protein
MEPEESPREKLLWGVNVGTFVGVPLRRFWEREFERELEGLDLGFVLDFLWWWEELEGLLVDEDEVEVLWRLRWAVTRARAAGGSCV